jgi:hypothetical protein
MHYIELGTVDSGYKLAYNELKIDGFSLEKNKTGNIIVYVLLLVKRGKKHVQMEWHYLLIQ